MTTIRPSSLRHPCHRLAGLMGLCAVGALVSLSALAAEPAPATNDAQARYEQERARCLSGQSGQAQATCLKEAGAARDAAKHNQLSDGDGKYRKNAKARCDALTGDDKRDCILRAKGDATETSGSVKGGGIIRESVTTEIGPPVLLVPASAPR